MAAGILWALLVFGAAFALVLAVADLRNRRR